jgi:hypothetical protein
MVMGRFLHFGIREFEGPRIVIAGIMNRENPKAFGGIAPGHRTSHMKRDSREEMWS